MKLKIKVKPNSRKQEIIKISPEEYKVFLKSPPENNQANIELVKLLSKYFKSPVRIVRGIKSRDKIAEVEDE